jgi:hypothetical protein
VNARVETFEYREGRQQSNQQTDEKGAIKELPVYFGDVGTGFIRVSKPGYLTYEAEELLYGYPLWEGEIRGYDPRGPIKIELLKIPVTAAERKAVEGEVQKRELFSAVRRPNVAKVIILLKAGVDPNATDNDLIPVILWAVASGSLDVVKALLAAGADVRSPDKMGRKALLYYLTGYHAVGNLKLELVQRLIEAGADVNAADKQGVKVLTIAKRLGDPNLVRLLEIAGAQN